MKSPIAGLLLLGLLQLVGCASTPNVPQSDIEKGTTTVDAVEGEQSKSKGLIDKLRHREDPVAGDPAWGPVRPRYLQSTMSQQRDPYLIRLMLLICMTTRDHIVLAILLLSYWKKKRQRKRVPLQSSISQRI